MPENGRTLHRAGRPAVTLPNVGRAHGTSPEGAKVGATTQEAGESSKLGRIDKQSSRQFAKTSAVSKNRQSGHGASQR